MKQEPMNHEREAHALRDQIATTKRKLAELDPNSRSASEVKSVLSKHLDALEAQGVAYLDNWADRLASGHNPEGLFVLTARGQPPRVDVGPLMVALIGRDRVEKLAAARTSAVVPDGPSASERSAAKVRALAELHALEVREEAAIRAAAMQGVVIDRRADARPDVVLALEPEA